MSAPDPIEPLARFDASSSTPGQQAAGVAMYLLAAFLFALNGSVAKA